jgi:hypothetical protein
MPPDRVGLMSGLRQLRCGVCFQLVLPSGWSRFAPLPRQQVAREAEALCPCWPPQGQRTVGGIDDRIASTLPPVFRPKMVPRSYNRLYST